ncbi:MAG: hypothetical protein HN348_27765, partial [Proteobacteria bacterium]|nr:hypothetical protein [Pseudomonadota bacterium]
LTLSDLVVDGNRASSGGGLAITANSATPPATIIEDVTFSNNSAAFNGGGMFFETVSAVPTTLELTLSNVTFHSNRADNQGGGAVFDNAYINVDTVYFFDNTVGVSNAALWAEGLRGDWTDLWVEGNQTDAGGNLVAYFYPNGLGPFSLDRATFTGNTAGTILMTSGHLFDDTTFSNIVVIDNIANDAGVGIGANHVFHNMVVAANSGVGMSISQAGSNMATSISHVTVAHNDGHGIILSGDSALQTGTVALFDSIVAFNGGSGVQGGAQNWEPAISYTNGYSNNGGDFINFMTDPTGTNNNISVDPWFVDDGAVSPLDWDLSLQQGSQCEGVGTIGEDLGAHGGVEADIP